MWLTVAFAIWIIYLTISQLSSINALTGVPQPSWLAWFSNLPLWVTLGVVPTLFIGLISVSLAVYYLDAKHTKNRHANRRLSSSSRGSAVGTAVLAILGILFLLVVVFFLSQLGLTLAGLFAALQHFLTGH
jgi:hypothetical protein